MKRLIGNLALFALLVIGLNQLIIAALPYTWGESLIHAKQAHYLEHASDYNTLIMGSSRAYFHISPEILAQTDERPPLNAYNLGASGYYYPKTQILLEELLQNPAPQLRYVIFEFELDNTVSADNLHTQWLTYWYTPEYTQLMIESAQQANEEGQTANHFIALIEKHLNLGYGKELLSFALREQFGSNNTLAEENDGFTTLDYASQSDPLLVARSENFRQNAEILEEREALVLGEFGRKPTTYNAAHLEKIQRLLTLANTRNIHIFFVLPPRLTGYTELLPVFNQIPPQHRINLADPEKYPQFYQVETSFDMTHMNAEGAEIFSNALARALEQKLPHLPVASD